MTDAPRPDLTEERNVIYQGSLSGRFFFAPKVQRMDNGVMLVQGRKYDITEQLKPYLKAKFLRKVK